VESRHALSGTESWSNGKVGKEEGWRRKRGVGEAVEIVLLFEVVEDSNQLTEVVEVGGSV